MEVPGADALRQWKTDAWKAPSMVASYYNTVSDDHGKNRLKNHIECSLCERYSVGNDILDVGIGTGRASLPLARKGKKVTGTDSSESMLEVTRQLAGNVPVTLKVADVERQPFPDASFDTAMALNVVVHFRDWEKIMAEMLRVVRPGGRVLFDIYSLDHELTADLCTAGKTEYRENTVDFRNFLCRVKAEDIAKEATRQGATLHTLIPFNPFFGVSRWPFMVGGNHKWHRMLSWFHEDEALFECARFLEEDIIGKLSVSLAPKIMVVLEKRADPEANARWLRDYRKMESALSAGVSAETLAPFVGKAPDALRAAFGAHASQGRARAYMYRVWKLLHSVGFAMRPHRIFPTEVAEVFWEWHLQEEADERMIGFLREWRMLPAVRRTLTYRSVPLAEGLFHSQARNAFRLSRPLPGGSDH